MKLKKPDRFDLKVKIRLNLIHFNQQIQSVEIQVAPLKKECLIHSDLNLPPDSDLNLPPDWIQKKRIEFYQKNQKIKNKMRKKKRYLENMTF